jgi:hypothetical protein
MFTLVFIVGQRDKKTPSTNGSFTMSKFSLATTFSPDRVADVMVALTRMGVLSADMGRVTDGVGVRLLRKEETIDYRQIRCEEDELARMWTLYPRNE